MITIDLTKGLICASVQAGPEADEWWKMTTQPCSGKACTTWFKDGSCTAGVETTETFRHRMRPDTIMPECNLAGRCHWNLVALRNGDRGCPPRMLGLLCEHRADGTNDDVAIWNTFDMADPDDDEAWRQR